MKAQDPVQRYNEKHIKVPFEYLMISNAEQCDDFSIFQQGVEWSVVTLRGKEIWPFDGNIIKPCVLDFVVAIAKVHVIKRKKQSFVKISVKCFTVLQLGLIRFLESCLGTCLK